MGRAEEVSYTECKSKDINVILRWHHAAEGCSAFKEFLKITRDWHVRLVSLALPHSLFIPCSAKMFCARRFLMSSTRPLQIQATLLLDSTSACSPVASLHR